MSKFETTLRQIIYHYSQDKLPIEIAQAEKVSYNMPSGKVVTFAPIRKIQDIPIENRIEVCKDILVPQSLNFFSEEMRAEYYELFCIENLEREIEYETVGYFLLKWKSNIKKCVMKYNAIYRDLAESALWLYDYERHTEIKDDDDTLHGRIIDGSGTDTLTHGLKTENKTETESNQKTVFEDTPENELLNENYATNITKTGNQAEGLNTTTNSGSDINSMINHTAESGKTERDYSRLLNEYGRNRPIAEIMRELLESKTNVIENMVQETSSGLFIKIY